MTWVLLLSRHQRQHPDTAHSRRSLASYFVRSISSITIVPPDTEKRLTSQNIQRRVTLNFEFRLPFLLWMCCKLDHEL
jgi:hypothetical protein